MSGTSALVRGVDRTVLLQGKVIGFGLTGSLCTMERAVKAMAGLKAEGAELYPVINQSVADSASRFGQGGEWVRQAAAIAGREPARSVEGAEPIGPRRLLDLMVILPCTGNTLAKLATGITDTPVSMAAKAHLRNERPLVVGLASNDLLGLNARNLGTLLAVRNVYFVPFGQDSPKEKPRSLEARFELLLPTILEALCGRQLQPVLLGPREA